MVRTRTDHRAWWAILVTLVMTASMLSVGVEEADAASWTCGYAKTTRYGYGGVTGSKLAVHTMRSDYCWNGTDTKDGAITDHRAWSMGWTSLAMKVKTDGEKNAKVGTTYHSTGYAYAETCATGNLGFLCAKSDHYIKHQMKKNGWVTKYYPSKWWV